MTGVVIARVMTDVAVVATVAGGFVVDSAMMTGAVLVAVTWTVVTAA